ncbi:MAG: membrane protein insertase YidC [Pseudomonadota bacterium]|nr:membrane protein insertase YidC [Pseudomonadota bacterium]
MTDFRRLFLISALVLVLMLLWTRWAAFESEGSGANRAGRAGSSDPATSVMQGGATTASKPSTTDLPSVPRIESSAPAAKSSPGNIPAESKPATQSGERIVVETDLLRVQLDTHGGDLRTLELTAYLAELDQPDEPFQLLDDSGPDLYWLRNGLLGNSDKLPNHGSLYTAKRKQYRLAEGDDRIEVPLFYQAEGIEYRKVYTFYRDSYYVDVRYEVKNNSADVWTGYLYSEFLSTERQATSSVGFFGIGTLPSYTGAAIYTPAETYKKIDYEDMREQQFAAGGQGNRQEYAKTPSGWVAMLQHYFVGALLAKEDSQYGYEFYSAVRDAGTKPEYLVGFKRRAPLVVGGGLSGEVGTRMFLGPKETARLEEAEQQLELAVDYGWLTPISQPLFWLLTHIQNFVVNWGIAIILLTLLVKLVFYPLSAASYKSMAKMKKLGPRMKTLKERYGDDKQKFQQAMMEMYKKDKINPLGGCLPIVVQIPVFIALYWVLLESVELRHAPFALWIHDLSSPDPFYVLPILMGASMFGQQLLNPTPVEPMQANIMRILPIVFTLFFLWFPAGLVLYWLVNNLLSIAQQWFVMRKYN